ncbi:S26 family signal peptidase, partial [Siminovitchia fortis]|uniref:S26 family signal peptidase n=1 Tax=Siminovitchia fortis TaxID=254758 RepID=UPI0021B46D96
MVLDGGEEKDYMKGVIGVGGERVEYVSESLYVKGKGYEEGYLERYKEQTGEGPVSEDFRLEEIRGEKSVREGEVLVMGEK